MAESRTTSANRLHKTLNILFIVVCAGLVVWWTFRTPFEPAKLYRAIPAEASAVSIHEHPQKSWAAFSENPVLKDLLGRLGVAEEMNALLSRNATARQLIARGSRQETVLAYVPPAGGSGEPAWIASSWMGTACIPIRWMLVLGRFPEFKEIGKHAGWSIWAIEEPLTVSGMRLSIAAGEGMILACVSRQRDGVRRAISAYEGLAPSSSGKEALLSESEASAADRGWFHVGKSLASFRVANVGPDALSVVFRVHQDIENRPSLNAVVDTTVPGQLLDDIPSICAACSLSTARGLLPTLFPSRWASLVSNLLEAGAFQPAANALILAVLTGDYEGGFGIPPLRMRFPTVVAMFKANGQEPEPLVRRLLDDLNAAYRAGLIIRPDPAIIGNYRVHVLEATGGSILSRLEPDDRPAYSSCGDWLIFSSNARALSALLTRFQNPRSEPRDGAWRRRLLDADPAALFWMDLDSGGKALQLPLALWSLQAGAGGAGQRTQEHLSLARALLEEARRFGSLELTMDAGSAQPVVRMIVRKDINPATP